MTITLTPTIEMLLTVIITDEAGNILTDEAGNILTAYGWENVTSDALVNSSPRWSHGNNGRSVFDRVSNIGSFTFVLDNSETNDRQTLGYYSPDNSAVAERFGLDTRVRIKLSDGGIVHEEWQGTISRIAPTAGIYGPRTVAITCEDWMANAYRDKIRGITVQTDKRTDQILDVILPLASAQPIITTSFQLGDDAFAYALHDENSESFTIARIFQKLVMSDFGRIYLTGFGDLKYIPRSQLITSGTPLAALNGNMQDLRVTRSKSQRVKEINVTTYPVEIDSSPAVLWAAQKEISIAAGATISFDVALRDPNGRSTRISATSLEPPAASTDYKLSSTSGSGEDLNANLTVTPVLKADIVTFTLTNSAAVTGYLWFHKQRGTGVYLYEPVTQTASTGQADGETLNIDMVYQDDQLVGEDILNLLTSWYTVDQSDVESVTFFANGSQALTDAAFLQPGDLVSITETLTGIDDYFIINGIEKELRPGNNLFVTWYLVPANQVSGVCFLDLVGYAELDLTAFLGA